MAKKITIRPIREWAEREDKRILDSTRLYIGKYHVATVRPVKRGSNLFYCDTFFEFMHINGQNTLEDIKMQIELSFKEFIARVLLDFEHDTTKLIHKTDKVTTTKTIKGKVNTIQITTS